MISKEEIKRLADLARIEVGESEAEELAGEMDAILAYVGQVKEVASSVESARVPSPYKREGPREAGGGVNVMREDDNPTPSGTYSKELIAEFPKSEGNYLKVKKIL